DQRLNFDQHRPAPFEGREHGRAGRAHGPLGEERGRRIRDLGEAPLAHLEDAHLVGRAEAVLHGTQHTERVRPVALEVEDGIDEVLEHWRARERALLGDVTDEEAGGLARLASCDEERGRLAYLTHAARRRGEGRVCSVWIESTTTAAGRTRSIC